MTIMSVWSLSVFIVGPFYWCLIIINLIDHDLSVSQILLKNAAIEKANPQLWQWIKQQVVEAGERVGLRH